MTLLPSLIGGGVSALAGAGIYHYVDKWRTRARLIQCLFVELTIVSDDLSEQIEEFEADDPAGIYEYYVDAFRIIRTTEPRLYAELMMNTQVGDAYTGLKQWNEDQILHKRDEGVPLEEIRSVEDLEEMKNMVDDTRSHLKGSYMGLTNSIRRKIRRMEIESG